MADITIYTTNYCPYCSQAKALLERKGESNFNEIDVTESDELRQEMMEKSGGGRTVPQIFINGNHVGGFDNLAELERQGELDKMLA